MLFTYGADGMRTSQVQKDSTGAVTATYSYIYNGGKLVRMTYNGTVVEFTYDASGAPLTMTVGNSVYYYVTNLQGDVIGIKDSSGQWAAQYSYDAWGNILTQTGTLAALNPLRYRGYVYDDYTGWYYLQSRYYNPKLCRFINADTYAATGQGFVGNNMFAYCNNNPVMFIDRTGTILGLDDLMYAATALIVCLVVVPVFIMGVQVVTEVATEIDRQIQTQVHMLQAEILQEEKEIVETLTTKTATAEPKNNYHLHHMVAKNASAAEPARRILREVGIDVNNGINLVPIKQTIHQRLHTAMYYKYINQRIIIAYKRGEGDKDKQLFYVRKELNSIRTFLSGLNKLLP